MRFKFNGMMWSTAHRQTAWTLSVLFTVITQTMAITSHSADSGSAGVTDTQNPVNADLSIVLSYQAARVQDKSQR